MKRTKKIIAMFLAVVMTLATFTAMGKISFAATTARWVVAGDTSGFDPYSIGYAIVLNDQEGALGLLGHQALLLVDKNGAAEYFSFF